MVIKFTPKSEEEIEKELLLPEAEYDFHIVSAKQKQSNAGNDMFELDVLVFHEFGQRKLKDYVVTGNAWGQKKLCRLCKATGLESRYDTGELDSIELEGRTGRCKVGQQEGQNGYGPKNVINDYIAPEGGAAHVERQPAMAASTPAAQWLEPSDPSDSQIPF